VFVDDDKLWFTILDYVGATDLFYDPEFDGVPELTAEETIDAHGNVIRSTEAGEAVEAAKEGGEVETPIADDSEGEPRKFYVDGVHVQVLREFVKELDPLGNQLRVQSFEDYTRQQVHTLYGNAGAIRSYWRDPERRGQVIAELASRGISFEHLAEAAKMPDADPFDLLIHVAFNAPLRSRRERAEAVRREHKDFLSGYSPQCRAVLDYLLDKYTDHGVTQLADLSILNLPDVPVKGTPMEIAKEFGGPEQLKKAALKLQELIYAA
jgi:type I restriction enzyme R subunit